MIERHVTFDVLPEKNREFEQLFVEEYRPAMASMPGYVRVELLRDQDDVHRYQMLIRFDSLDSAAAWRNSEAHQALSPKLKSLYSASQLQVYDFIA
jgi:antibiotic biosynthesis monooxygenase (ABM) superfamily enzyme